MMAMVDYTFVDVQLGPQHSSSNADNVDIEQLHAAHKWALFKTVKPFKFSVPSTTHIRKLEARANRKFVFYGMRPEVWWYNLYSKPMGEVSYLNYE